MASISQFSRIILQNYAATVDSHAKSAAAFQQLRLYPSNM